MRQLPKEQAMSTPRFSVVIPTRERAATLRFALRTVLDQPFDDYEVIVSDNCSSPATKAVVEEAASPKVRYVRTAEPVAMSANWEFAVSHARGEYVTVLGDDDGLLPHALAELDRLARTHAAKAIRWDTAFYTWPTILFAGHGNYLRVPLLSGAAERIGTEVIAAVSGLRESYEQLPMIYNTAVRRDVIEDIRRRGGAVFPHPIPDVYSGFAIAHAAGRFLTTTLPMSVRGVSAASNGVATLYEPGRTDIEREFNALNAKAGFPPEPTIPDLPALPAYAASAYLTARRLLFPNTGPDPDRRAVARACLAEVRVVAADWPVALSAVRRSFADDPTLTMWFDTELAARPHTPPQPVLLRPTELGFDGSALHLDAAAFGVVDVHGAARLCERVLNCTTRPIHYTAAEDGAAVARKVAELTAPLGEGGKDIVRQALGWGELVREMRVLRERVATLEADRSALMAVCAEREEIIGRLARQHAAERRWSLKRPLRAARRLLAALTRPGAGTPTASA
jgi:glycosyltransferase involved in cell wall biosynthesis